MRVVVAGGGVAALETALALRRLAEERVRIELVSPEPRFWYRPLAVVEPFDVGHLHGLDLGDLAEACGATLVLDALASVDPEARLAVTARGAELEYDVLVVASGARPVTAVPGALTFRGPADIGLFRRLLSELESRAVRRVAFAFPAGASWPLPLYELALQTSARLRRAGIADAELTLVTHEDEPFALFGAEASSTVAELLERSGIALRTSEYPTAFRDGWLELVPGEVVPADRVVALPRLEGRPIPGLPHDADGFVPTDGSGRVRGLDDVYAVGDVTSFPVKQGGLAAQQADAAAEAIAAAAGADLDPQPFRPVLRGLILTGGVPTFVRAELGGGRGNTSEAPSEALWWPPGKIVGRYLAPFLAERAGLILTPPGDAAAIPVDVEIAEEPARSE